MVVTPEKNIELVLAYFIQCNGSLFLAPLRLFGKPVLSEVEVLTAQGERKKTFRSC